MAGPAREGARPHQRYRDLVGGSLRLLVTEPVLRRRAWHGACAFAAFSVLWTTLAFLLSVGPYNYSNLVIGLFGLVGAGGIAAANLAGKLADSDRHTASTVGAGILLAGSFGLLWMGRTSLAALIIGIVVLDMGTQGMQITNQAVIYALRPDARSRINSAYMVCYFIGGALGSFAAGALYGSYGWAGVCLLGDRPRPGHAGHVALRAGPARGRPRSGFDDLEPVAVLIAEGEHRGHTRPPQHLVGIDARRSQGGVGRVDIDGGQPHARLDPRPVPFVGSFERERDGCAHRRHLDPTTPFSERHVEAGLETERARVESQSLVLVGDRDPDRAHAGDG